MELPENLQYSLTKKASTEIKYRKVRNAVHIRTRKTLAPSLFCAMHELYPSEHVFRQAFLLLRRIGITRRSFADFIAGMLYQTVTPPLRGLPHKNKYVICAGCHSLGTRFSQEIQTRPTRHWRFVNQ